jgi:hypothetical protein
MQVSISAVLLEVALAEEIFITQLRTKVSTMKSLHCCRLVVIRLTHIKMYCRAFGC